MTTRYRCDQNPCRKGYHVPFADGTAQSNSFKQASQLPINWSMDEVFTCVCERGLIVPVEDPQPQQQVDDDDVVKEWYGVLLLVCDLSGSMGVALRGSDGVRPARGARFGDPSRWELVTDAVAKLLSDFSQSGNHYDRLLLSVVRFGKNFSTFRLKTRNGPPEGVRWFTTKMLAQAEAWPTANYDVFDQDAIRDTVRKSMLPRSAVDGAGTNLAPALEEAQRLAELVCSPPPKCPELPENFGGIEVMQQIPGSNLSFQKFWGVIYSDGLVGDESRALACKDALQAAAPGMIRLTAFFGDESDAAAAAGGQLMAKLATSCTLDHPAPVPAYFDHHESQRLRHIIRLATSAEGKGFCPQCLLKYDGAPAAPP